MIDTANDTATVSLGVWAADSGETHVGAKVADVRPGSPAARGGLREGDVITRLDSAATDDVDDLAGILSRYRPGDKVVVSYRRDNREATVTVTFAPAQWRTIWPTDASV